MTAPDQDHGDEHTVSAAFAYILATVVVLVALAGFMYLHILVWGSDDLIFSLWILLAFIPLTVAHEE
jgi:hypothetical protein